MIKYYIQASMRVGKTVAKLLGLLFAIFLALVIQVYVGTLGTALYVGSIMIGIAIHLKARELYEVRRRELESNMGTNFREFEHAVCYTPRLEYSIEPRKKMEKAMEEYKAEFGEDRIYEYYKGKVDYLIAKHTFQEWEEALNDARKWMKEEN